MIKPLNKIESKISKKIQETLNDEHWLVRSVLGFLLLLALGQY